MNQSTVPHDEIRLRLSICCEFLLDEKRPIREAYESVINKIGRELIEYSEFEFWFKRFANNQFDLGYDANQISPDINSNIVSETSSNEPEFEKTPIMIAKKIYLKTEKIGKTNHLESNHQFDIQNMLKMFGTLIDNKTERISLHFNESTCEMRSDDTLIFMKKKFSRRNSTGWSIRYRGADRSVFKMNLNAERFIMDHLWFVLSNPKLKLKCLYIGNYGTRNQFFMDFGKLDCMLQAMFNSFHHQIHASYFHTAFFNENTVYEMLRRIKPGTLETISFEISWKEEGNYRKMKEIVELDQWKQASAIYSPRITPLTIDDVLHFNTISLLCASITPEDVVRVRNHFLKSAGSDSCALSIKNARIDFDGIEKALQSKTLEPKITRNNNRNQVVYRYPLQDPERILRLILDEDAVFFNNVDIKNDQLFDF